ncbi:hypothetical protein BGX29_002609 [Mortierella sp. GBA35]|nr:hypothetical protein BGX29_002609 [Mortierella sp. GBA35]
MPSVINNHFSTTSTPSELDLLSDDATPSYYNRSLNSNQQDNRPIQDLKDRRRRQWLEPEDEFSVPIHTESPLITKSPLDMSSFLLNYRAMRRSVEIMTPPPSPSSNKNHSSSDTSNGLHPTLPDGPIYIHHRSTITGSPLSNIISCAHVQCFEHHHSHHLSVPSPKAPDCRMNRVLSNSALTLESKDHHHYDYAQQQDASSINNSSRRTSGTTTPTAASGEHSFLESHIASIGQWLTFNAV